MAEKVYAPGECYRYQLIIKHLLETPLFFAPDQEIVYRDRVRLTYRKAQRADPPAGQRSGEAGRQAGRYGLRLRLRQPSLSGVLLRRPHDGGGPSHPELASVAGTDPLYDEPCGGQGRPCPRGFSAPPGGHLPSTCHRREDRPDLRRRPASRNPAPHRRGVRGAPPGGSRLLRLPRSRREHAGHHSSIRRERPAFPRASIFPTASSSSMPRPR